MDNPSIVIAGASGYIGKGLIPELLKKFPQAQITALSRSAQKSQDARVIWKACDLFSLRSVEEALPLKVDLAFYLVHSMGATAHLDQGSFADYDLILADNFARTLLKLRIKQLIYLGGLVPETEELSEHLRSRLEVEEIFLQYKLPTTIFRAGLILGEAGSSSQILVKLVRRLPIMICPPWTQRLTTPVDLATVLFSLTAAALDPVRFNNVYDLAGCQALTYLRMMQITAQHIGKRRFFFPLPLSIQTISRHWVAFITNSPKELVYPLIESLEHSMVARKTHLFSRKCLETSFAKLIKDIPLKVQSRHQLFKYRPNQRTVRSVQRIRLPEGKNAEWIKDKYLEFLPSFLAPFIKIEIKGTRIIFSIFSSKIVLLELNLNEQRSDADRQLLYIIGGLLVADKNRGRLEFRVVLNRKYVLAAIHDFTPALPWLIYKYTQAKIHLLIMKKFSIGLNKQAQ